MKKLIDFGVDSLYYSRLTKDDATGATYEELIWLEGCQNVNITETSSSYTLPGDNGTVDTRSKTEGYEIEIAVGVLPLDVLRDMKGGELVEVKDSVDTAKVVKRTLVNSSTDTGEAFGLIAFVESSNKKIILPKVKATTVDIAQSNLTHGVATIKATAIRRDFDKVMRMIEQAEVATAPAVEDFEKPVQA